MKISLLLVALIQTGALVGCDGPVSFPHLSGSPFENARRIEFSIASEARGDRRACSIEDPHAIRALLGPMKIREHSLSIDESEGVRDSDPVDLLITDVFSRRFKACRVLPSVYRFESGQVVDVGIDFFDRVESLLSKRLGTEVKLSPSLSQSHYD